jgi:hypothetical protein
MKPTISLLARLIKKMSEARILTELDNTKFYRTVDSIEKLKLRVILKQVGNAQHPLIESKNFLKLSFGENKLCHFVTAVYGQMEGGGRVQ